MTPFSKPSAPSEPTAPTIDIKGFDPAAPDVTAPDLPIAPTFNIQLGSYRNYMTQKPLDKQVVEDFLEMEYHTVQVRIKQ